MGNLLKFFVLLPALLLPFSSALALDSVNVMADNAMSVAIAEIARNYSRDKNVIVNTSFVSPKLQQEQITEGAAADILITPLAPWIETLKTQGLVDVYSQTAVARNRLALVGPSDSQLDVRLARDFPVAAIIREIGYEPGFVVGNPETMLEGAYSKEALRNMDVADYLEPYTLYIKSPDQMLEMVTRQKAYGVFFYSNVIGREDVRVLDVFPESAHKPIQYYAVVIAGENMDAARQFLEYLKTNSAKKAFRENGFASD